MFEGYTNSSSGEKAERNMKKKKAYQKEIVQSTETCSVSMKILDFQEEKKDGNQAKLDSAFVEIEILTIENKYQKKLLHMCDEKEHEFKENIISLRKNLEEDIRVEDVINN